MTGAELIPASAWVQAAFVCLFIVLVVSMLAWFSKQSDKWQKFMFDIDEKWRAFNREQREENNSCMSDVNKGLTNLAQVTQGLVNEVKEMRAESRQFAVDLEKHDEQAREFIYRMQAAKPAPKPRAPKVKDASTY